MSVDVLLLRKGVKKPGQGTHDDAGDDQLQDDAGSVDWSHVSP